MNRTKLTLGFMVLALSTFSQYDTLKTYYENGNLRSKKYLEKSKMLEKVFYENGALKMDTEFGKDSLPKRLLYYKEDGKLYQKIEKGKLIEYLPEFDAVMYYKIKKHKLHGIAKMYQHEKLVLKMKYSEGMPIGEAIGYNGETGDISFKEYYNNGRLNGVAEYFGPGKILQRKIYFEDDCPTKVEIFEPNGNIAYETIDKKEINDRYRSTDKCKRVFSNYIEDK